MKTTQLMAQTVLFLIAKTKCIDSKLLNMDNIEEGTWGKFQGMQCKYYLNHFEGLISIHIQITQI